MILIVGGLLGIDRCGIAINIVKYYFNLFNQMALKRSY